MIYNFDRITNIRIIASLLFLQKVKTQCMNTGKNRLWLKHTKPQLGTANETDFIPKTVFFQTRVGYCCSPNPSD